MKVVSRRCSVVSTKLNNKIMKTEKERDSSSDRNETKHPAKRFIARKSGINDNESDEEAPTKINNSPESKGNINELNADGVKRSEKNISPRKKRQSLEKIQVSPKRKLSTQSKVLDIDSSTCEKINKDRKSPARRNLNHILNGEPLKQRLSICDKGTSSEEEEEPKKRMPRKFALSIDKCKNAKQKSSNSKLTQSVLVWKQNEQVSDNAELSVSHEQKQLSPRKTSVAKYETSSEESNGDTAPSLPNNRKSPKKKMISSDESEAEKVPVTEVVKSREPETDGQCQRNELTTKSTKKKLHLSNSTKISTKRKHPDNHVSETKSVKRAKLTPLSKLEDTISDSDDTDSLTKLNTTINKSMAFMENKDTEIEMVKTSKSRKSVSINTKENLQFALNDSRAQKSILKKPEQVVSTDNNDSKRAENIQLITASSKILKRPSNLQDLKDQERFVDDFSKASFGLDDISDDDEIYIIDVPRTIDPVKMKGQMIKLGSKNKFQIEDQLYETSSKEPINISCVFRTNKEKNSYKTVNVRPAGWINVRQRLSKTLHVKLFPLEKRTVPFPSDLKTRHPLFGAEYEDKITVADNILKKTSRSATKARSCQ